MSSKIFSHLPKALQTKSIIKINLNPKEWLQNSRYRSKHVLDEFKAKPNREY